MDRLALATAQLGLPPLEGVRHIDTSGALDRWVLAFQGEQADLFLTRVLWSTGRDPLQCSIAALKILETEDLPVASGMRIFPDGAMDHPTAIETAPPGVSSRLLVQRAPEAIQHILSALGRTMAQLEELYQVRFGTRGDGGQFAPTRATWRDEWRGLAEIQLVGAQAAGLGDLGVATRLWAAIDEGIAGLPASVVSTVVHFGLRPASLRFAVDADGPRVVQVGELGESLAGDPLAAWAPMLCRFGGADLSEVFDGYGRERIPELLEDDTVAKIQLYARTRALGLLRDAAQRAREQPSDDAARAIEKAVHLCERAASDTWARDLLQAGLDKSSTGSSFVPESPADRIERRVIIGLAAGPTPPSDRAPHLIGALAASDLARLTDGENAQVFLNRGSMFVDAARMPSAVLPALPISDRAAWRSALIEVAREQCTGAGPALGIGLLAAGLHVVDRLGDQVSSRSLRGLEALVLASFAKEAALRTSSGLEARDRVSHGVIGQDAALRLGLTELADAWQNQLLDALDVLSVAKVRPRRGSSVASMEQLLPVLTRPTNYAGRALLMLPMAAAVHRLGGQGLLVDQAGSLFQAAFANS